MKIKSFLKILTICGCLSFAALNSADATNNVSENSEINSVEFSESSVNREDLNSLLKNVVSNFLNKHKLLCKEKDDASEFNAVKDNFKKINEPKYSFRKTMQICSGFDEIVSTMQKSKYYVSFILIMDQLFNNFYEVSNNVDVKTDLNNNLKKFDSSDFINGLIDRAVDELDETVTKFHQNKLKFSQNKLNEEKNNICLKFKSNLIDFKENFRDVNKISFVSCNANSFVNDFLDLFFNFE